MMYLCSEIPNIKYTHSLIVFILSFKSSNFLNTFEATEVIIYYLYRLVLIAQISHEYNGYFLDKER